MSRPVHPVLRLRRSVPAACTAVLLGLLCALAPEAARAQVRSGDFALTYTQERSKFAGTACGCFYLRGATADFGYSFYKGLGFAASATGVAATNLRGSIDIEQISLLVGPRYTYNLGFIGPASSNRRGGVFGEGKIGYTFATSGLYPVGNTIAGNASALTYQLGGGFNLTLYERFDLRLIEADFVRTQLPNGGSNQQNLLRLASGINFHFGH